jgi:hypothetical protein
MRSPWHPPPDDRRHATEILGRLRTTVAAVDLGRPVGSWMEGAAAVPDALPADVRARAQAVADRVDPDHRIARNRFLV